MINDEMMKCNFHQEHCVVTFSLGSMGKLTEALYFIYVH
jgi:hypothetical protein